MAKKRQQTGFEKAIIRSKTHKEWNDLMGQLCDSFAELVALGEQNIEDAGPCDHTTGICLCGDIEKVMRAKALLTTGRIG